MIPCLCLTLILLLKISWNSQGELRNASVSSDHQLLSQILIPGKHTRSGKAFGPESMGVADHTVCIGLYLIKQSVFLQAHYCHTLGVPRCLGQYGASVNSSTRPPVAVSINS